MTEKLRPLSICDVVSPMRDCLSKNTDDWFTMDTPWVHDGYVWCVNGHIMCRTRLEDDRERNDYTDAKRPPVDRFKSEFNREVKQWLPAKSMKLVRVEIDREIYTCAVAGKAYIQSRYWSIIESCRGEIESAENKKSPIRWRVIDDISSPIEGLIMPFIITDSVIRELIDDF